MSALRKQVFRPWFFVVVLVVCLVLTTGCHGPDRHPHVVLILVDALRAGNLSRFGYDRHTSPHIDAFATNAISFDNAASIAGSTPPAMAGIMTGRLPYFDFGDVWDDRGCFGMHHFYLSEKEKGLPKSLQSLADHFKGAGYVTAGFITNPYVKAEFNFDQGFDHYEELMLKRGYQRAEVVTNSAIGFLDSHLKTDLRTPVFLYLHYMDVHAPYYPPDEYRKFFDFDRVDGKQDWQVLQAWEKDEKSTPDELRAMRSHALGLYDCSLRYVDDQIGRVIAAVEERGLQSETIIAVTSDHGEEFLEHGGTTHKGQLFEEMIHVPFLIRIPGVRPRRVDQLVRNFDLMPTLLDFAGVEFDHRGLDAVSLRPLIEGKSTTLDLDVYANFPWIRMFRDDRYKLLQRDGKFFVYDLEKDPGERHSIADDESAAEVRAHLENRMFEIVGRLKVGPMRGVTSPDSALRDMTDISNPLKGRENNQEDLDDETREQLRALGYLE